MDSAETIARRLALRAVVKRPALTALRIMQQSPTHAKGIAAIVAAGLAEDAADADALVYEGEQIEARGL